MIARASIPFGVEANVRAYVRNPALFPMRTLLPFVYIAHYDVVLFINPSELDGNSKSSVIAR